jgi:tetratricopeptide (TPR) repeat protein
LKIGRNYSWLHILHSAAIVGIDTRTSTSHPGRRLGSSGWSGITKAVMPDERLSWVCPTSSAHSHAYDTRAHIYEALGRKEEALADFRKALALNPDNPDKPGGPDAPSRHALDGRQRITRGAGYHLAARATLFGCLRGGSWPSKSAIANWAIIALLIETAKLNGTVADDAEHAPCETAWGFCGRF